MFPVEVKYTFIQAFIVKLWQ